MADDLMVSPISEWSEFLGAIEEHTVAHDASTLSCGCVVSESIFTQQQAGIDNCPQCGNLAQVLAPATQLRNIYNIIQEKKQQLGLAILKGPDDQSNLGTSLDSRGGGNSDIHSRTVSFAERSGAQSARSDEWYMESAPSVGADSTSTPDGLVASHKLSLAEIFQSAAKNVSSEHPNIYKIDSRIATINLSASSQLTSTSSHEQIATSSYQASSTAKPNTAYLEQREKFFQKCFPTHRKQYQHYLKKGINKKTFISMAISPDASKIALCSTKKWYAYTTPEDFNDAPKLLCKGELAQEEEGTDEEYQQLSMSNRYLAISTVSGRVRLYDLENSGKCVYHNQSKFSIRYMVISSNGSLIACAITGIDNVTKQEQPMIVLHWIQLGDHAPALTQYSNSVEETPLQGFTYQQVETVTITIPYQDVINSLSFSWNGSYLTCSTNTTSHILIIDVTSPHEPRLLLKTSRYSDRTPESEGITGIEFFPNNRYFAVTSVAQSSNPMILDSQLSSKEEIAPRVSVLHRVEKVGSQIHKSCISSRRSDNIVTFLDKNGLIYLMHTRNKRIFVVTEVSGAKTYKQSAAMRFDPSGHALFVLDRKGIFYVLDFAAGLPQQAGMGKCRILT